jgi:hypothetical protein
VSMNDHNQTLVKKVTHTVITKIRKGQGATIRIKRFWSFVLTHTPLARFYRMWGEEVNHSRWSTDYYQRLFCSILVISLAFSTVDKDGIL